MTANAADLVRRVAATRRAASRAVAAACAAGVKIGPPRPVTPLCPVCWQPATRTYPHHNIAAHLDSPVPVPPSVTILRDGKPFRYRPAPLPRQECPGSHQPFHITVTAQQSTHRELVEL
jgi:hypothetical protein